MPRRDRDLEHPNARMQRQNEVLAAYANSLPGTTIGAILKLCKLHQSTASRWILSTPGFYDRLRAIQERRARIDFSDFERYMHALRKTLVYKGLAGDVAAIGLIEELLGNRRTGPIVNVDQRVGVQSNVVGMEELLERRAELSALVVRHRESEVTAAEGSADPGPGPNGGGAAGEPTSA